MPQQVLTDSKEIEATINEFEKKLDRLKILYEQYFMGIEKREPLVPLKDVVRVMRLLDNEQIRNTGLRFRFRNLVQRFNVYRTYWNRTLREIEKGTYHRDLSRLRRSLERKGIEMPKVGTLRSVADVERAMANAAEAAQRPSDDTDRLPALDNPVAEVRGMPADQLRGRLPEPEPSFGPIDLDDEPEEETARRAIAQQVTARPSRPPRPRSTPDLHADGPDLPPRPPSSPGMRPPPARTPSSPGMRPPPARTPSSPPASAAPTDPEIQSLYRRFVKAKQLCGEDTSSVHYESLKKSIEHQLPKIKKMYEGRDVEFQVVIRNGRAVLKAKPK
jgi:hypothetical protein